MKKISFQEISNDFIKNNFELVISIYLFTKKSFNLFSINDLIQFHLYLIFFKKKLFTIIVSNKFITKFQFANKNDFYLLLP